MIQISVIVFNLLMLTILINCYEYYHGHAVRIPEDCNTPAQRAAGV